MVPRLTRRAMLASLAAAPAAAAAGRKYRIIDPHVHVWKRDPRFPWAKETTNPPARDATPAMLLELMKANGVEKTVIIQVIHYRWDNSYLAEVLRRYPGHFKGVARVNPEDPAAADHLSRLVEEQRFEGVRLSPAVDVSGDWIRGPLMPPLWQRCRSLRVPMTILTRPARLPDVARLIDKVPDLVVVIDHMADSPPDRPEELAKLTALARYPKVFVKISHTWSLSKQSYPYLDAQEQVRRLYDVFGPKRLMWGTDWPLVENHCGYARALELVRDHMAFLNDDDRGWVLGKTVERVWRFR